MSRLYKLLVTIVVLHGLKLLFSIKVLIHVDEVLTTILYQLVIEEVSSRDIVVIANHDHILIFKQFVSNDVLYLHGLDFKGRRINDIVVQNYSACYMPKN